MKQAVINGGFVQSGSRVRIEVLGSDTVWLANQTEQIATLCMDTVYIREQKSTMTRDQGYQLPDICQSLLPVRSQRQKGSIRDHGCSSK